MGFNWAEGEAEVLTHCIWRLESRDWERGSQGRVRGWRGAL